jgi:succinyl-CoA synthetase beta subunit
VVFAINLPSGLADKIKPDVGAAALIMEPSNDYIAMLQELYIDNGITLNEVNPLQVDRSYFLQMLAMAYVQDHIPAAALTLLTA